MSDEQKSVGNTGKDCVQQSLLGKYAESSTTSSNRLRNYEAQYHVRGLLLARGAEQVEAGVLGHVFNIHKTAKCLYIRHSSAVQINQSTKFDSTFYSGLVVCGNLWACPVCASKIQERRRIEVAQAFDYAHRRLKQKVIMVTFTIPHVKADKLNDLFDILKRSFARLRKSNSWSLMKKRNHYTGMIRSTEVTIGNNGWHPHTHEAWIVGRHVDVDELRDWIANQWLNACRKNGLEVENEKAFLKRSVQITDNCSTSDYLAKQDDSRNWGMDRELVKGTSKVNPKKPNKNKTRHPFSLIREYVEGNKEAGSLFLEYVFSMKGRSQLFWSPGLKDLVGVNDISDEELANEARDKTTYVLAMLSKEEWKVIISQDVDVRGKVLNYASRFGIKGLRTYLRILGNRYRRSQKDVSNDKLSVEKVASSDSPDLPF